MRFLLNGKGEPIMEIALPEYTLSGSLPPQTLILEDGVPFLKADWMSLGYTHYEVFCVGGAGGRGADGNGRGYTLPGEPGNGLAYLGVSWPYYYVPLPGGGGTQHFHDPYLSGGEIYGGGGGGGGMHIVAGALDELPDSCDVAVGQAGADAGTMQISQPTPITPNIATTYPEAIANPGWLYAPGGVYDPPHLVFPPAADGEDGGASTFGDDICQASGGKGGKACARWDANRLWVSGNGGEGGSGGRSEAGGGGPGSNSDANPPDGSWDGSIGKGGGGGRGGQQTIMPPQIQWSAD